MIDKYTEPVIMSKKSNMKNVLTRHLLSIKIKENAMNLIILSLICFYFVPVNAVAAVCCDSTNIPVLVKSSAASTTAANETTTEYIAYLDTPT